MNFISSNCMSRLTKVVLIFSRLKKWNIKADELYFLISRPHAILFALFYFAFLFKWVLYIIVRRGSTKGLRALIYIQRG